MEKYELVKDDCIIIFNGHKLFRIRALKDFQTIHGLTVNTGDLGGFVESEKNLSQEDNCWVSDNAKVFDNARVFNNACVYGNACVCENACVYDDAWVYGDACVFENAKVYGDTCVYGDACVFGDACVCGNARVFNDARVFGNARVFNDACVYGDAKVGNNADICNDTDYIYVKGLGGISATTFYKCKDNQIGVTCGFFKGTLDEFISHLKSTHKDHKFGKEYLAVVEAVKIHFGLD